MTFVTDFNKLKNGGKIGLYGHDSNDAKVKIDTALSFAAINGVGAAFTRSDNYIILTNLTTRS